MVHDKVGLQPELHNGDRMSGDEFMRRWEETPELKKAELIEGVVHLALLASNPHSAYEAFFGAWLTYYAVAAKQDLWIGSNPTLKLEGSVVQPDVALVRGRTSLKGGYLNEIPELVVEVCYSSKSYDLGQKLATYHSAGLRDHIAVLTQARRVEWRVITGAKCRLLHPTKNGILSSPNFPGLWLDTQALFPLHRQRLFAAIDRGFNK